MKKKLTKNRGFNSKGFFYSKHTKGLVVDGGSEVPDPTEASSAAEEEGGVVLPATAAKWK